MATAANLLRRDVLPLAGEKAPKPLVMVTVRDGVFQQCVGTLIDHVTSGNSAGTSWIRPLALRSAQNASLAVAAESYDPVIGWLNVDVGGGSVHLFGPLAPAAFVPTAQCEPVPPALALAVRSLSEAHAASAEAATLADQTLADDDMRVLQTFMTHVAREPDDGESDAQQRGFYYPLAGL